MPDWTYHPVLKPLSGWMNTDSRRRVALRGLQAVVSVPGGWMVPDLLGHMHPPAWLEATVGGRRFRSPVGLGGGVDPDGVAIGAFGRFGFGFIEVGPYVLGTVPVPGLLPALLVVGQEPNRLGARLRRRVNGVPVWLRLVVSARDPQAVVIVREFLAGLHEPVDAICLSVQDDDRDGAGDAPQDWPGLVRAAKDHASMVLADLLPSDTDDAVALRLAAGVSGVVLRACASSSATSEKIRQVRRRCPHGAIVVADCAARSPQDVVTAMEAGADLVELDVGFVETGPGLAKRANEAVAGRLVKRTPEADLGRTIYARGWPWILALGAGMWIAGLVVLWVGVTRVLLPYDEAFLGVHYDELSQISPRLLGFMRHDRVTLAGTLMSIGVLYGALAWFGMRHGQRWARRVMLASGIVGFASLFLFLGFHYVDPLHVVLSLGLFPLFLLGMVLKNPSERLPGRDLVNDRAWRTGLIGQLIFVGLGVGLIAAGLTITTVGVTRVFVFSDLQFLGATSAVLSRANPHLLPLIAHDRAGFGGALASDGVAVLLLALWGFRRGERWVWWTLLLAGLVGLMCGIYAHLAVGYLEFGHLLPVFVSSVVLACGLAFSFRFLLAPRRG
ncbi:MAG: hypothetical protein M3077_05140 [Candidatus Dormibacteraeota bacterium]|nr:hypothetical protein [Candidatus Dormibacteraeota bacterium]